MRFCLFLCLVGASLFTVGSVTGTSPQYDVNPSDSQPCDDINDGGCLACTGAHGVCADYTRYTGFIISSADAGSTYSHVYSEQGVCTYTIPCSDGDPIPYSECSRATVTSSKRCEDVEYEGGGSAPVCDTCMEGDPVVESCERTIKGTNDPDSVPDTRLGDIECQEAGL